MASRWALVWALIWPLAGSITAEAQAESARLVVFPTEGNLAAPLAAVPGEITRALGTEAKKRGFQVSMAQASLADTALILGCAPKSSSCQSQILTRLEGDKGVYATITGQRDDGFVVSLKLIDAAEGSVKRRRFEISATDTQAAVAEFTRRVPEIFGARPKPAPPKEPDEPSPRTDEPSPRTDEPSPRTDKPSPKTDEQNIDTGKPDARRESTPKTRRRRRPRRGRRADEQEIRSASRQDATTAVDSSPGPGGATGSTTIPPDDDRGAGWGRVDNKSWALIAGGGVAIGAGFGFWLSTQSRQQEIDDAPTESAADLERLAELEDSVRLRANIGNVFVTVGVLAVAVGIVRALYQAKSGDEPGTANTAVRIDPTPITGGAGLVVSGSW